MNLLIRALALAFLWIAGGWISPWAVGPQECLAQGVQRPASPEARGPGSLPFQIQEGPSRAAKPFIDFWGAVQDFGRDIWAVASAPARLDRSGAVTLGGVLAVAGVLYAYDEEISEAMNALSNPEGSGGVLREVGDFVEPVGLQGDTNVYFAGLAVLGYLTQQDWLKEPAKQILYSQWIGGMGRQLVGHLVGRQRPSRDEGPYSFEPGEGTSFPSGHSAVAFELATVLSHHIDRRPISVLLYALATAMAFQRVDSGSHWASDAFLGSAWGYFVARTVIATEESHRVIVEPALSVDSGKMGLGVVIHF
jgi:hypothetical protein